jgi:adenylyl-sulfate kinase
MSRVNIYMETNETYWLTGLPCSGKTAIATLFAEKLKDLGYHAVILDGDKVRKGMCSDLGFSDEDRKENLRRVSNSCNIWNSNNVIVIASFVSPTDDIRAIPEEIIENLNMVHVATPLEVCEERDSKGMYKLAREGKLPNFTGVDGDFEIPHASDMELNASGTVEDAVARLIKHFNIK